MKNSNDIPLIELTPNPVVAFGMRLGRDELIAAGWSAFWTAIVKLGLVYLGSEQISLEKQAVILALAGPLFEKPGLISAYIKDAIKLYKQTPEEQRAPYGFYIKKVFKDSWPTLRADLLFHDPGYTLIFWLLIQNIPSASPLMIALLSAVSFSTAVFIAAGLDVLTVKIMYCLLIRKITKIGFKKKQYYEARFLVDAEDNDNFNATKALDMLQLHFQLPIRTQHTYHDVYLNKKSTRVFNGRRPYLRFRQRIDIDGEITKQAIQIMYTTSRKINNNICNLYRCFITAKEKCGYEFLHDEPMPWQPENIKNKRIASIVKKLSNTQERKKVSFTRDLAIDKQGLFISTDKAADTATSSNLYWLEVKVKTDLELLQSATEYIAWKLPVRATTKTKCDDLWQS